VSLVATVNVDQLPEIGSVPITVEGVEVAIVRDGSGRVFAVRDECSHAQVRLSEGEVEGGSIECWMHGATFDLGTGRPLCLPATQPVPVYRVAVIDGQVYVDVHARPDEQPPASELSDLSAGDRRPAAAKEH